MALQITPANLLYAFASCNPCRARATISAVPFKCPGMKKERCHRSMGFIEFHTEEDAEKALTVRISRGRPWKMKRVGRRVDFAEVEDAKEWHFHMEREVDDASRVMRTGRDMRIEGVGGSEDPAATTATNFADGGDTEEGAARVKRKTRWDIGPRDVTEVASAAPFSRFQSGSTIVGLNAITTPTTGTKTTPPRPRKRRWVISLGDVTEVESPATHQRKIIWDFGPGDVEEQGSTTKRQRTEDSETEIVDVEENDEVEQGGRKRKRDDEDEKDERDVKRQNDGLPLRLI